MRPSILSALFIAALGFGCTKSPSTAQEHVSYFSSIFSDRNADIDVLGRGIGEAYERASIDCSAGGEDTYEISECMGRDYTAENAKMRHFLAVARERFVGGFASNLDSATRQTAIAEFDRAQADWESFADHHCHSVMEGYRGGSIIGAAGAACRIQLMRIRTRLLWQEWMTYVDSTPPMLPQPDSGFVDWTHN